MATGKIANWIGDRGFGFIENDAGGPNVFLHISEVAQDDRGALINGTEVAFDMKETPRGLAASNVRFQETSSLVQGATDSSSSDARHSFHNPYTFVPTPPRQDAIKTDGFASDFDPLECGLSHTSLKQNLWTGHLPIKLTTVTPLVLPKTDGEERSSTKHQTYDVLDHLSESSLRGMLRSVYEVVTNSRYGCFSNSDRLAYRMRPQEVLSLIPAVIENGSGKLVIRLYPGNSRTTPRGPGGPMYAALLTRYHRDSSANSVCVGGYDPRTRDEVWAEIDSRRHRRGYQYWKAIKVWPKSTYSNKPAATGKVVEGRVLITNENMGNKHDERIFFNPLSCTFNVTDALEEAWRMRIQSYRDAHSENDIFKRKGALDKPWKKLGRDPGDTAWSPHLYQDGKHLDRWERKVHDVSELQQGDMVYARCKFDDTGNITGVEDLFPVMISRELYDKSPADLLDSSLRPADKMSELSPADRLFGWVPQQSGSDQGYKSRIRVVCEDGARPEIIEKFNGGALPLAILGQPKPAQGHFYVAKDNKGTPQDDRISKPQAGYSKGKGLRGRKQYWHHKGLEADQVLDYWNPSVEDRTQQKSNGRYQEYRRPDKDGDPDSQNRSITGWIKPGTVFKASLYVQNLQTEEIGALLWLLSLPEDHYFRLGYGKPLGFGSVRMEVDEERCVNGCLPLGTGEDWKGYYAAFNASPLATLNEDQRKGCIQKFKASMVAAYDPLPDNNEVANDNEGEDTSGKSRKLTPLADLKDVTIKTIPNTPEDQKKSEEQRFYALPFISGFIQVLKGPEKDAPIHYPRLDSKPNPEGENFKWFGDNEKGKKLALPAVTDEKGLPYQP